MQDSVEAGNPQIEFQSMGKNISKMYNRVVSNDNYPRNKSLYTGNEKWRKKRKSKRKLKKFCGGIRKIRSG